MTRLVINPEDVLALGAALEALGSDLSAPAALQAADGIPAGATEVALTDLLGNWELARRRLVRAVGTLAEDVATAGSAYLDLESSLAADLHGG